MPLRAASTRSPERQDLNFLLAALPASEYRHLAADLDPVHLQSGQLLAMPDEPSRWVYFVRDAVVSLLVPMSDGSAVEGATIGNEGMVGIEVF
ncbi:MAG TPA: cyclic nucleotide-binding domain-containing protein, partial [Chloroflexota bacterium]|nr:cyclic nucleotide-binding domain-containing protein [Chloroflexota bacterium]